MNEFELIDAILEALGPVSQAPSVVVGPGDDAAAVRVPPDALLVSSIDSLVAGVHFPPDAAPERIGYRALMVSLSDLAAMGADASHVLVSLTLDSADVRWATGLATGMRRAAESAHVALVGGNITHGPLSIHVSVHGFAPVAGLLRRSGASAGEHIYVTGDLGGAAAALARGDLASHAEASDLLTERYFAPQARLAAGVALRGIATAAIDVSDGLLQDLEHLCAASGVGASLDSARIPICAGATLENALSGGDDYELLFTAPAQANPENAPLHVPLTRIGTITAPPGILLDGKPTSATGYRHFS